MQGTQRRMAFLLVNSSEMGNGRKGAFWEDRYHATAVASGEHLRRCIVYIDFIWYESELLVILRNGHLAALGKSKSHGENVL